MVHHPKWLLASFIVEKCARRLDHLNLWPCRHVASVGKTSFPVFLHGILQESTGRTCPPPRRQLELAQIPAGQMFAE